MAKSVRKVLKSAKSIGSSATPSKLIRDGKVVETKEQPKVTAVPGGADMSSVAVSSLVSIDAQLTSFADKLSDTTLQDLDIGIEATETKQRNALDVYFDLTEDFKGDINALVGSYPAPYSEAPKNMTPALWETNNKKTGKNDPWPYDKWSERITQAQGGKRNVNYVWFKETYLKTKRGKAHAKAVADIQEQITNYGKTPLTGSFQNMELDELQTMEKKLSRRITTASDNLRDAVSLVRQFVAFNPYKDQVAFAVLLETDKDGNQIPSASRLPIRVQTVTVTMAGNEKIVERLNKKPVSIDTFLNYNADKFAENLKIAGKSVYDALLESPVVSVDTEEKTKATIELPLNDDRLLAVCGLMAHYLLDQSNMSRLIKLLGERDAKNEPKHAAEVASFLDVHIATLPIYSTFQSWYDRRNLAQQQTTKAAS